MKKIKNFLTIVSAVQKWGQPVIAVATWIGECLDRFPVDAFKSVES